MFYKECDGKWVWVGLCVQKSNNVYIIINYKGVLTHKATEREREREVSRFVSRTCNGTKCFCTFSSEIFRTELTQLQMLNLEDEIQLPE